PASRASCQRGAQRHQRSPGLSPRKPNSGTGVERSLPRDLENARNAAVMTAQTVWLPMSSCSVSQQPSRKNPVMGLIEHTSSRSPSTLRGLFGRPPPCPLSSLSMAVSARVNVFRDTPEKATRPHPLAFLPGQRHPVPGPGAAVICGGLFLLVVVLGLNLLLLLHGRLLA